MLSDYEQNNTDLESYTDRFEELLDGYVIAYVNEKMVPDAEEYQTTFTQIDDGIDTVNNNLFVKKNNIHTSINEINGRIQEKTKELTGLKDDNEEYKRKLANVIGKENASFLLTGDSFEIYKYQYIINWTMILAIVVLIRTLYKSFNKKIG